MSGHSKWSTIKRQKEAKDQARGKLFSRLAKGITIAVKTGGGADPNSNHKLRVAIEIAKQSNMPKHNIERAISKGSGGEDLQEVVYEGFGPSGIGILVEVATDNRNRTAQEIKSTFERGEGTLAGPGAVSFNFEPKGFILLKKKPNTENQMLTLIDLGVEDIEETEDGIEIYTVSSELFQTKEALESKGITVLKTELIQHPKSLIEINNQSQAQKAISLLESLEDLDGVQRVFSNLDITC